MQHRPPTPEDRSPVLWVLLTFLVLSIGVGIAALCLGAFQ